MESDVVKDGDVPSCPDLLGCAHTPCPVMIASSESGIITRVCHPVQGLHNGPMPYYSDPVCDMAAIETVRDEMGSAEKEGKRCTGDNAEVTFTGIKRVINVYQFGMDRGCREASPTGW